MPSHKPDDLDLLDLRDADGVAAILHAGADANRTAPCRRGACDVVESPLDPDASDAGPPPVLLATGDLHDNPMHFARLVELFERPADPDDAGRTHLTLHELIHSDRLINGMDFSYRVLARVAWLKAKHPSRVHVLLANHELAQLTGRGIVKDGVNVVEAFDAALDFAFDEHAPTVRQGVREFIASMPIALRWGPRHGVDGARVLCAHSVPSPWALEGFDPGVLDREPTSEDRAHRTGSAYRMVWGHSHNAESLSSLASAWGVDLFVLGHEKAEHGIETLAPNAVILNSDHERGVVLPLRWGRGHAPHDCVPLVRRLSV